MRSLQKVIRRRRNRMFLMTLLLLGLSHANPPSLMANDSTTPPWLEPSRHFLLTLNEAIEPKLQDSDRSTYEKALPWLSTEPEQAMSIILRERIPEERSAVFHFLLGSLSYQVDQFQEAQVHLQRAVKAFPNFRRALRLLALAQVRIEDFRSAQGSIARVIALGGGDEQSYGLLAQLHEQQEHHSSALTAYRMARMFDPSNDTLIRGEAHALLQLGDHAQAVSLLNELIGAGNAEVRDWRWMSQAYLGLGDHDRALANLEVLYSAGQADHEALLLLGHLYFQETLFDRALDRYGLALEQGSSSGETWTQEALISLLGPLERLVQLEHWSLAEKLKDMLTQTKKVLLTSHSRDRLECLSLTIELNVLSASSASEPEWNELLSECQALVDGSPLFAPALMLMAQVHKKMNHIPMTEFYLERAAQHSEFSLRAWMALGECAVEQRQYDKALTWYKKAQKLRGDRALETYLLELKRRVASQ